MSSTSMNLQVSRKKSKPKKPLSQYMFVLPCFVLVFCVVIFPFLYSFGVSFTGQDLRLSNEWNFIGLKNYALIFTDSRALNAFKHTLTIGIPALCIELLLGMSLALLLNRDFPLRQLTITLFVLPVAVPPLVVGFIWRTMLHPKYGIINDIIYRVGFHIRPEWLSSPVLAPIAVMFVDVWQWTPFVMLILLAGLRQLPHELYEAATIDGAGKLQFFRSITLPLISRYITVSALFRAAYLVLLFDPIFILTFGGPSGVTETIGFYTYLVGFKFFRMGYAASISYILLIITILISLGILRLQREVVK